MAVTTFVAVLAVWRYGFLAGVVAWVVASTLSGIVEFFASGSAEFMVPAIVGVVLILAPSALAFVAYRRYATVATGTGRIGLTTTPVAVKVRS